MDHDGIIIVDKIDDESNDLINKLQIGWENEMNVSVDEKIQDDNAQNQDISIPINEEQKTNKKMRGLPKTILVNQQKYQDILEKQHKIIKKKKTTDNSKIKSNGKNMTHVDSKKNSEINEKEGLKKVIFNGVIKWIKQEVKNDSIKQEVENDLIKQEMKNDSIKQEMKNDSIKQEVENDSIKQEISNYSTKSESKKMGKFDDISQINKVTQKLPTMMAKKMDIYNNSMMNKQIEKTEKQTTSDRKIPPKYAKQIQLEIKKQTTKNVKNFSDLRRVKAIEDIDPNIGMNTCKASIHELRKMKLEQRMRANKEAKQQMEANKRESAIQNIMNNQDMSKFAKTVAIKNLSVNSRHQKKHKPKPPNAERVAELTH